MRLCQIGFSLLVSLTSLGAQAPGEGPTWPSTPPMGWNSWDCYGTSVTEQQVKANADYMAEHLARFGWNYVVVDIQWYEPEAKGHTYNPAARHTLDVFGRLQPAPNRFPSSRDGEGFKALAAYVHGKGLKFGIHIMRGIPRQAVERNLPIQDTGFHARDIADTTQSCEWNPDMWGIDIHKPGAQAYYNSIAELYASWGVDFIKADDMGSHQFRPGEMNALHQAIQKTGRPMVLSVSPGPAPLDQARFLREHAQMWRVSDDFWDDWRLLQKQFEYAAAWSKEIGKNHTWPDADMLPLGQLRMVKNGGKGEPTRFTAAEQRTLMTLWCMIRSPLIFGGDLPSNDPATLALLTNPEVLAVNQRSRENRPLGTRSGLVLWTAKADAGEDRYVAIFNLGERKRTLTMPWRDLDIKGAVEVRDLWEQKSLGRQLRLRAVVAPHECALLRISKEPEGALQED